MLGLAFSGGKDSLACWYLCRQDNPIVLWVNTGKSYPETRSVVEMIRSETSRFIEIPTDQDGQVSANGIPSDIVPIDCTTFGAQFTGEPEIKVQSYLQCCYENISKPLTDAAKANGITRLICGQRDEEAHKAPATNGQIVDGIERVQPIQKWTKAEVIGYLKSKMAEIPEHFALEHSSMDCYDCTAYMEQSIDRIEWTRTRHPELFSKYESKMGRLRAAIAPSVRFLGGSL